MQAVTISRFNKEIVCSENFMGIFDDQLILFAQIP